MCVVSCVVVCVVGCVVMGVVCRHPCGRLAGGGLTCGSLLAAAYLADLLAAGLLAAAPHPSSTEIGTARRSGWRWRHVARLLREAVRQLLGAGLRRGGRQCGSCSGLVCVGKGGRAAGFSAAWQRATKARAARRQNLLFLRGRLLENSTVPSDENRSRRKARSRPERGRQTPKKPAARRPYRSRRAPKCCRAPTVPKQTSPEVLPPADRYNSATSRHRQPPRRAVPISVLLGGAAAASKPAASKPAK